MSNKMEVNDFLSNSQFEIKILNNEKIGTIEIEYVFNIKDIEGHNDLIIRDKMKVERNDNFSNVIVSVCSEASQKIKSIQHNALKAIDKIKLPS